MTALWSPDVVCVAIEGSMSAPFLASRCETEGKRSTEIDTTVQKRLIHGIVNRTQSNSIELNSWIEFDWIRQSNEIELTEKKENQSNQNERSIFELVICVKQALKTIHNQILAWKLELLEPGV